jgi:hypothetical protein
MREMTKSKERCWLKALRTNEKSGLPCFIKKQPEIDDLKFRAVSTRAYEMNGSFAT